MKAMKLVSGLLCVLIGVNTLVADEVKLKEKQFKRCLLVEREGRVWLQEPMVYLGMVGVWDTPNFCLSAELAEELTLLVSKVVEGNRLTAGWFYTFEMPRLDKGADRFVVVWLETKMRPLEVDTSVIGGTDTRNPEAEVRVYEIVSARLKAVECVTKEWIKQWQELDAALNEVVSQNLLAPSEGKKKGLAAAIERGSQALNRMGELKVSDQFRALVKPIEPQASLVGTFKEGITQQWHDWLEKCAGRLRIEPKTPLPKRLLPEKPEAPSPVELLAKSNSPAEFIAEIKRSHGAGTLRTRMFHSPTLGRHVQVREIERMGEAQFDRVRAEALKLVSKSVEQWGVVLQLAGDDLLADKLILSAAVVERILPEQAQLGLRAGDIVIDYGHIYDVVMGWHNFRFRVRQLGNTARQKGRLRVLRGNEIITIDVKGKQ